MFDKNFIQEILVNSVKTKETMVFLLVMIGMGIYMSKNGFMTDDILCTLITIVASTCCGYKQSSNINKIEKKDNVKTKDYERGC